MTTTRMFFLPPSFWSDLYFYRIFIAFKFKSRL